MYSKEGNFNVILFDTDKTDYVVLNVSVPASMQPNGRVQVEVTAINDSVVEFTETFYVSGEAAPPGVPVVFIEPPAEVSILSEDGKCVVY